MRTETRLTHCQCWMASHCEYRTLFCSVPVMAHNSLQTTARPTHSSEPILVPKLRISLADFPYLHYSINQRLFTLETCCGYGYGSARKSHYRPQIFKGQRKHSGHRKSRGALRWQHPYLRVNRFHGVAHLTKKRQLFPGLSLTSLSLFALPHLTPLTGSISVSEFGNINPIPFRTQFHSGHYYWLIILL